MLRYLVYGGDFVIEYSTTSHRPLWVVVVVVAPFNSATFGGGHPRLAVGSH